MFLMKAYRKIEKLRWYGNMRKIVNYEFERIQDNFAETAEGLTTFSLRMGYFRPARTGIGGAPNEPQIHAKWEESFFTGLIGNSFNDSGITITIVKIPRKYFDEPLLIINPDSPSQVTGRTFYLEDVLTQNDSLSYETIYADGLIVRDVFGESQSNGRFYDIVSAPKREIDGYVFTVNETEDTEINQPAWWGGSAEGLSETLAIAYRYQEGVRELYERGMHPSQIRARAIANL